MHVHESARPTIQTRMRKLYIAVEDFPASVFATTVAEEKAVRSRGCQTFYVDTFLEHRIKVCRFSAESQTNKVVAENTSTMRAKFGLSKEADIFSIFSTEFTVKNDVTYSMSPMR
eukprot:gb/GECG01014074.1/.p1 GENE.gb/GECG01014074.1/~~gb/GECG01014074.1/.p1  ORF type:complete len:115 (+),score=10.92 gb/GECG01014074.1/:1-345(+)